MSQQQPQQVIIVQQPGPARCVDQSAFKIKEVLIPAVIMLVIAIINLGAYIYLAIVTDIYHAVIINAFVFFTVTAVLCICVSAMARYGLCIAALIWTIISLILAVIYLILMFLDMTVALLLQYEPTIAYDAVMIVLNFIAMACDIAAMVFISRVVCCGAGRSNNAVAQGGYPGPPPKY